MTLPFSKYCGSGNDFIAIDGRHTPFDLSLVSQLCNRRYGVGADGVILLEDHIEADIAMRIINSDGTEAEMCGNGLRCLAIFAQKLGCIDSKCCIATPAGLHHCVIAPPRVAIQYPPPNPIKEIQIDTHLFYTVNTGVPHALTLDPIKDFTQFAPPLRHHPSFGKAGTNISSLSFNGKEFVLRTFERGVTEETLACGTAACAAAQIALAKGHTSPIAIRVASGELLTVTEKSGRLWQEGVVHHLFDGNFFPTT